MLTTMIDILSSITIVFKRTKLKTIISNKPKRTFTLVHLYLIGASYVVVTSAPVFVYIYMFQLQISYVVVCHVLVKNVCLTSSELLQATKIMC